MTLAGDIGGTKTALAWVDGGTIAGSRTYSSTDHASLAEIVRDFVADRGPDRVSAACFGIAGPVVDGVVKTTNLPWVIDAKDLQALLGTSSVRLINDLEAIAYGVAAVGHEGVITLSAGRSDGTGNAAVIATGGVFVAGGIAPKILPALTDGTFLRAFVGKGRLQPVLEAMPVRVVVSDTIALLGAARAAVSRPERER